MGRLTEDRTTVQKHSKDADIKEEGELLSVSLKAEHLN